MHPLALTDQFRSGIGVNSIGPNSTVPSCRVFAACVRRCSLSCSVYTADVCLRCTPGLVLVWVRAMRTKTAYYLLHLCVYVPSELSSGWLCRQTNRNIECSHNRCYGLCRHDRLCAVKNSVNWLS